jgi:hypothetical protein
VSDYRLATVPKDGFGAQAGVLAAQLPADACVAVAPRTHEVYYLFLRPELEQQDLRGASRSGAGRSR